ncbi:hypothetical protein O181_070878 [Austropuccinia psidii MF-1]|uniref:Integrase catalytic domain-containing protein n=1 Tax=Austropuccinia psidii MF-1 TaxID=1389203 RepID=A0A9Q3F4P6_9BASI|nr:hypothetical protein [Austropuccinia psidii MF-1]
MVILNQILNLNEATVSLDEGFTKMQNLLHKLKSSLGGMWTDDSLLAMFFHQFNKAQFHHIANALDEKKSIDPSCIITEREVMQVAQRFQQPDEKKTDANVMALAAGRGQPNNISCQHYPPQTSQKPDESSKSQADNKPSRYPHPSMQSAAWATKWLSPEHPCSHCFEWVHWAMDFPRKLDGKPPIKDPKKRDATFRYRKSKFVSHPTLVSVEAKDEGEAKLMSIQATTEDSKLVLIDSGATHHVAGYCLLFITYKEINLELSAATKARHPVVGIGTIKLCTRDGDLWLHNTFHCKDVPGVIVCNSIKVNNSWFLNTIPTPCCNDISLKEKNLMSTLFHDRLAHVSMRTVRRMKKLGCVEGLPRDADFPDIPHCQSCTLAKSRHMPFMPALGQVACAPGDIITVDLMAFIPLKVKSDAAKHLKEWLVQFANIAHTTVKRVRTNNGGEFASAFLLSFFKEKGIVHERTIPYEHHQNSKVKRTNRTLAKAARSMMIRANPPPTFWTYALRHAAWVFNRVLHASRDTTPYEAVIKQKPSLSLLCVFGCKASASVALWEDTFPQINKTGAIQLKTIELKNLFDNRLIREMKEHDECLHLLNVSSMYCNGTRTNYHKAKSTPQAAEWMKACKEELRSLKSMGVWEEVEGDNTTQILGTQWVFALKSDSDGRPIRHKARLVVQGHQQVRGVNFEETFAMLQSTLPIASKNSWKINTFDVTSAYMHSKIDEVIFVRPPPGVTMWENKVLRLKKALYGLKQAGRCWWLHLKNVLQEIRFKANNNDQSTYVYKIGKEYAMLWIHVDDGVLVTRNDNIREKIKLNFTEKLKLRWNEDINSIVGIEIKRKGEGFYLKQPGLIAKLVEATDSQLTANQPLPEIKLESSPASQIDPRFAINAQHNHWKALKHLVDYINTTKHQTFKIGVDNTRKEMEVYVNANWGGEGSRSQHGFCIILFGTMVAWSLKQQSCISSSTCQAKYMALSFAAKEALWLASNLEDVIGHQCPVLLSNKAAIQIANNSSSKKKSRHIHRELHIINELVVNKKVTINWIATTEQMADIFTKAQGKLKTNQFRRCMEGLWGGVKKNVEEHNDSNK